MRLIRNTSTNPYFNMASEEYLLSNSNEPTIMLWQNEKTIVVGKNQNTISEINRDYCEKNKISVVRRLTGGGAVFHDMGNINFTIIEPFAKENVNNYTYFTNDLICYLKDKYNLNAEYIGRNDVLVDGKKICGNAQCVKNNKIMHHGCILYSADLSSLAKALNVKEAKISSKGIKSVKSRVVNLNMYINISVEKFLIDFEEYLLKKHNIKSAIEFTSSEKNAIENLAKTKYSTFEWNYGNSPCYNYQNIEKFPFGLLELNLDVENGVIREIVLNGDFFGKEDIEELQEKLVYVTHSTSEIKKALYNVQIENYITGCSNEQFLCMF